MQGMHEDDEELPLLVLDVPMGHDWQEDWPEEGL